MSLCIDCNGCPNCEPRYNRDTLPFGKMLLLNFMSGYRMLWRGSMRDGATLHRTWYRLLLLLVHASLILALQLGIWIGGKL